MRYSAAILAIVGAAAAQSSTVTGSNAVATGPSGCGASTDAIIQNCLGTELGILNSCAQSDYACQCNGWTLVNTCYNNCPSDPNAFGAQQNMQQFCAAAKAYGSSTSTTSGMMATGTAGSEDASSSVDSVQASISSAALAASTSANGNPIATGNDGNAAATQSQDGSAALATPALGLAAVLGLAALM